MTRQNGAGRRFTAPAQALALAAAYYVAGKLALLMAIPPGYAAAVWPAAGIALAGILLFGYRVWPGIVLGSFLVNLWTSLDATNAASILKSVALAISIGAGASLQAIVGALLVRRVAKYPNPLAREEDVLRFLLLGGPVSSVVSATWGVTTLSVVGVISPIQYPFTWWTWWVGDTIGAIIFAPLVLIWAAEPRRLASRRLLTVLLPICVMVALLVYVAATRSLEAWSVLAGGLLFAGVLEAFLLVVTGRAAAIEQLVADRTARLQALTRVNQVISSSLDMNEVLHEIAKAAAGLVDAPMASFWVVDEAARTLEVRAFSDEGLGADFPVRKLRFDQGGVGWVATHRRPLNVSDVFGDERFVARDWWRERGLDSFLALPVMFESSLLAVLALNGREPFRFGPDDQELLEGLVAQGAAAIRNASLYDILATAKTNVEQASRRTECVLNSTGEGIYGMDRQGRATFVNAAAATMTGYEVDELIGRPLHDVLHHCRPDGTPSPWEECPSAATLRDGTVHRLSETMFWRKDGTGLPVEYSSTPLREQGEIVGAVVTFRDITERRSAERVKDEFVATVSHELRTPLTAIKGHIELVLDEDAGPVTELQRRFLRVAHQNTDRLGALINDLLDVEKIESGRVQLRRDPLDLAAALREVVATFRLEAERQRLIFRDEIDELPVVVGDRDRLIQVFGNLVSNAIKYTPQGEVGIRAVPTYGQVEVVVHDTGIGISAEDRPHLFTKFFRSQETVVRDAGGTGLGLVIAKGIVDAHGGTIDVESQRGAGTRVRVLLPAVSEAAGVVPPAQPEQATVLVVDDEVSIRDLLLEYLQLWGYRGVVAATGAEGLELARGLVPDLIILDVRMPAPDGWETLQRLKDDSSTRHIPVLLHSVLEEPERAFRAGAADYLVKPMESARLREAILKALGKKPVPVYVVDSDPDREARLTDELWEIGCAVRSVQDLAGARTIRPTAPTVILVNRELSDGSTDELLRAWRADPAFGEAVVILTGDWPPGTEASQGTATLRIEAAQGRRAADLADQVRTVLERWRSAPHG